MTGNIRVIRVDGIGNIGVTELAEKDGITAAVFQGLWRVTVGQFKNAEATAKRPDRMVEPLNYT